MSSKRPSDEPINNETKTPRQELNEEEEESDKKDRVNIKHYHPHLIFDIDKKNVIKEHSPQEMAGPSNFALVKSFYRSRLSRNALFDDKFSRNAGAVQLYYKGGIQPFDIPGKKGGEYNTISCPITSVNSRNQPTTYGHSERLLMTMVLDDLIKADHEQNGIPPRPSDYIKGRYKTTDYYYNVLENMTNEAKTYRKYLEKKGLIVKMWSERIACSGVYEYKGEGCDTFMHNICPEGSQYGYIVPKICEKVIGMIGICSTAFRYVFEYIERAKPAVENSIIEAASNDPQVITQEIREENSNHEAKEDSVEETVKFKYYHPTSIFYNQLSDGNSSNQENMPQEMTGPRNSGLAISFYHSRYTRENQEGTGDSREYKKCNAAAIQLYHKDGVTVYKIPGQRREEYNVVSEHIKGVHYHSERILMKMILDDLIRADCDEKGIPPRPSDCIADVIDPSVVRELTVKGKEPIKSSVVGELTVNSNKYKKYLEEKNLIVKIWSERQACVGNISDEEGGDCKTFITSICPAGSQFGYIVEDLDPARDEGEQVKEAFSKFSKTFQEEFSTNKLP